MSKAAESTSVAQTLHEILQPQNIRVLDPLGEHASQPESSHTAGTHGGASPEPRPKLLCTNGHRDGAMGGGLGDLNSDQQSAGTIALSRLQTKLSIQLNIKSLIPSLKEHDLLTPHEEEQLLIPEVTRYTKVNLLCSWLPSKGDDFFEKFLQCLRNPESSIGTAHRELADTLEQLKKTAAAEMERAQRKQKKTQDTSHLDISEEVNTPPPFVGNPHEEHNEDEYANRQQGRPWWCSKMCFLSYSVLVLLLVGLIILGFVVGADFQLFINKFNATEVRPPLGYNNTTMELHFSLSNNLLDKGWISINRCQGYLYVANGYSCSDFRTEYTYNYTVCGKENFNRLFYYMLPRSTIMYTVKDGITKEVWVFTDFAEYNKIDRDLPKWSCSNPPSSPYVKCYFVNSVNNTITIGKDGEANYYIAYMPDESDMDICIKRVVYDEKKISSHFSKIRVGSTLVPFSFGNTFSHFDDSCVVFSVQNCSIYSPPLYGDLSVKIVKRSIDFIHVSAVWFVLLSSVLLVIVIVHVCHIRHRRRPGGYHMMTDAAE